MLDKTATVGHTAADDVTFVPQPLFGQAEFARELGHVTATHIFEFDSLEQIPDTLIRVEFWRVAWQLLQVQALGRSTRQEGFDRLPPMNRHSIPNDQELAFDLPQQQAEEPNDIFAPIGAVLHLHEQPAIGGDAADRGQVISRELHPQDRRLPSWCPGADGHRQQVEP